MAYAKICDKCSNTGKHDEEEVGPKGWATLEFKQCDQKGAELIWVHDLCPECAVLVHIYLGNKGYPVLKK